MASDDIAFLLVVIAALLFLALFIMNLGINELIQAVRELKESSYGK